MKTTLPSAISSIDEAKTFLTDLHANGEHYHPEDDATDIEWNCDEPTLAECLLLNDLMGMIYDLEGNNGNHATPVFDPCAYLIYLDHVNDGFTISNDGVVITLKDYVQANEWAAVQQYLVEIMSLEVGEEWPMPVHFGFTMIRRIK